MIDPPAFCRHQFASHEILGLNKMRVNSAPIIDYVKLGDRKISQHFNYEVLAFCKYFLLKR